MFVGPSLQDYVMIAFLVGGVDDRCVYGVLGWKRPDELLAGAHVGPAQLSPMS